MSPEQLAKAQNRLREKIQLATQVAKKHVMACIKCACRAAGKVAKELHHKHGIPKAEAIRLGCVAVYRAICCRKIRP